jgi:hypothetical protein
MTSVESFFGGERGFSRASILASDEMPAQHLPARRIAVAVSVCSRDQLLIGEALACCGDDQAIEARKREAFNISFIQPERKFVDVSAKMFRAGVVVNTMQPTLEHCPHAFDSVRRLAYSEFTL